MKLPITALSTLLFLSTSSLHAGTKIYQWVDDNGKVHFSDTASPGTSEITADNKNLFSADILKTKALALDNSETETETVAQPNQKTEPINTTPEKIMKYKATITSPQNDVAIRSNEGTIEVHVQTTPERKNGQKLQLFLDGQKLGSPQISPTIRALNIDRGTHQVQVLLLDEKGKSLAKTQVVTVHLQRVSAN